MKNILVLGDWFVDEHWVVGNHRSDMSSRTGPRHTRALHSATTSVRSLCGAGQVATVLHQASDGGMPAYNILGVGLWRHGDESHLCAMLDPENNVGNTPHTLQIEQREPGSVKLVNLLPAGYESRVGTNRVIRIYERRRALVRLRDRIDWQLSYGGQVNDWIAEQKDSLQAALDGEEVDMIVIKDLGKGAVNRTTVRMLAERHPNCPWYISSKLWLPKWLEDIDPANVRLYLIPQLAAMRAAREIETFTSRWISNEGAVSHEALKQLDDLQKRFASALLVVLPEGMSLLARDPDAEKEATGIKQVTVGDADLMNLVPMASVFFPALVSTLDADGANARGALRKSLHFVQDWMETERGRLVDTERWKPSEDQKLTLDAEVPTGSARWVWKTFGWESARRHWSLSTKKLGVVHYQSRGETKLQLWRAMTEVPGYVAMTPRKKRVLKALLERGARFLRGEDQRHESCLLIDKPGSGKSFLVSRLAKALGMRYLSFNITQLLRREDLYHCFDTIATTQSQTPDEHFLVFVDEINARLEGQHVYDAFLAPLEDGIYRRTGNTFRIAPCFWVFAGTELPSGKPGRSKSGADRRPADRSEKGSDFVSRLTLPPMKLAPKKSHREEALVERVYVAVATVQAVFPDVTRVSRRVLEAVTILPDRLGARGLRQFVERLENVQYGRVAVENLPESWNEVYGVDEAAFMRWERQKSDQLVSIETSPGREEDL